MDFSHKHPFYLARPREGSSFVDPNNRETFSLRELAQLINSETAETQENGLSKMGLIFLEKHLLVRFVETGKCYSNPKGDRTQLAESASEDNFSLRLPLVKPHVEDVRLDLKIDLSPFIQDGVNFIGTVICTTPEGGIRRIPMTGTGTVALEGRPADCHAGFCTGPACASFQQRCAILLGAATAAGVHAANFDLFALRLEKVNTIYHGRKDILDYTTQCASTDIEETYLDYMKKTYESKDPPPMVKAFTDGRGPIDAYYEKLPDKIGKEEMEKEHRSWKEANKKKTSGGNGSSPSSQPLARSIAIISIAVIIGAVAIYLAVRSS